MHESFSGRREVVGNKKIADRLACCRRSTARLIFEAFGFRRLCCEGTLWYSKCWTRPRTSRLLIHSAGPFAPAETPHLGGASCGGSDVLVSVFGYDSTSSLRFFGGASNIATGSTVEFQLSPVNGWPTAPATPLQSYVEVT